jgi:hypothetical protein
VIERSTSEGAGRSMVHSWLQDWQTIVTLTTERPSTVSTLRARPIPDALRAEGAEVVRGAPTS